MKPGRIGSFDLSPDGRRVVVVGDGSGTPQPWVFPLDNPEAAVRFPVEGAAQRCVWRPDGSRFAVVVDPDGREDNQLYEIEPDTGAVHEVCVRPGVRHELGVPYAAGSSPYSPDGRLLAYATNGRVSDVFDVVVRDLTTGTERTVVRAGEDVPADRYLPAVFSPDSRQLLVIRLHQNTEYQVYVSDVDTGAVRLLVGGDGPGKYQPVAWRPEGIYLCATRDGDFTGLALLTPDGRMDWLDAPDRDVDYAAVAADGSRLAWFVNHDGYSAMRHRGPDGETHEVTSLPPGVAAEELGLFGFAPRLDATGREAVVLLGRPGMPPQLWRVGLPEGTATPVGRQPEPVIAPPEVVRFGAPATVSGLLYRPAGDGPFPAVLVVHGGPEAQARPSSDYMVDKFVGAGMAVLAPNIRGSSGFGLRFQRQVYRDWGGGDLVDLRAAAEFLGTVSWIDPDRIGVYGASYGGFASLSCATRLPEYWRAVAAECAVADLVADVRTFPPTWRRRARDWVGDPDDAADHARLAAASPLSYVDAVRAPVLLVHGTNDTRADIGSVDAFHTELRRLGKEVDYHRIDGAGHNMAEQGVDSSTVICDWLAKRLDA
ncbi:alpha/beta hydrolase family protein [Labedaea rhizosphaerae]|uniref:Dipeptidyl aminopeptidase/acylaminoacyl peptidase n=1 Tax=Labedaea rhizosphaerae TaxID=598644 RepID=A0A4V3CX54_LABRH|nr:prolyl oligopeptidase family serine peptidase [Labedaea rhizosphaerae]TDP88888.1 dipeptidyl aminopeptidase/acylaminoacyl peptidase [Labedaea rhizosphaerae]